MQNVGINTCLASIYQIFQTISNALGETYQKQRQAGMTANVFDVYYRPQLPEIS